MKRWFLLLPIVLVLGWAYVSPTLPWAKVTSVPLSEALEIQREPALSSPVPTPWPTPVQIRIPSLELEARITEVGLDAEKRMAVPTDAWEVGWYQFGPKPGEIGSAVLAGHVDTATSAAVFAPLSKISPGDSIVVTDTTGTAWQFRVERTAVYTDADFPIATVFSQKDQPHLNLITCSGRFDQAAQKYEDRLVVFAVLDSTQPPPVP